MTARSMYCSYKVGNVFGTAVFTCSCAFTSKIPGEDSDGSQLQPARSRQRVIVKRHLSSIRKPLQRKPELEHPFQRGYNSGKYGAGQTVVDVKACKTQQSNELDYALAKQLCLLHKQNHK